jgi:hypothetical protein
MKSTFDPAALTALYGGHGERALDISAKLANVHQIALKAMDSIADRDRKLVSLSESLALLHIDINHVAEARAASRELVAENSQLHELSSQSLAKCLFILDRILEEDGVGVDERARLFQGTRDMCIDALPEKSQPRWRSYLDEISMALASSSAPADKAARPRL